MTSEAAEPFVLVGRILAPVGLQGEVRVEVNSDVPHRFSPGAFLYVAQEAYAIRRSRPVRQGLVLGLVGVDSRAQAESLRGKALEVTVSDVPPPPEGSYYYFQMLEMHVFTQEGDYLGEVIEILPTGSNDVYVVSNGKKETLVPALADVVVDVNLEAKRMTVSLPNGL